LPDAELSIVSWDATAGVLRLKIMKEIGSETGWLILRGVTHVNLPLSITIAGMEVGGLHELPPNFLESYRPFDQRLDPEEKAFLIRAAWGGEFFVIAQRADYEIGQA
jgi:hypothetical protein